MEHKQRAKNTFVSVSGSKRISDAFDVILPKVRRIFRFLRTDADLDLEYPSDGNERV